MKRPARHELARCFGKLKGFVAASATFSRFCEASRPRALHDGKLPAGADRPDQNVFFKNGTDGGMVRVDLGEVISIRAVDTYSCHPSNRAPQIYTLYASDGEGTGFVLSPQRGSDLEKLGWRRIASVATGMHGDFGGQWAVSISGVTATVSHDISFT